MTVIVSTKKIPHKIGKNNSIRKKIANVAITPPSIKLPESPIKIFAGKALNHKQVRQEKNNAQLKIIDSKIPGMKRELANRAKSLFPTKKETTTKTKSANNEFFKARPSIPSVKFTALEVPAMMKVNMNA